KPVKSVEWTIPKVPDTTPREGIVATNSVMMSDGSLIKVPGALSTLATAINNSGQIVGSFAYGQPPKTMGFLKTKRSFKSFNVPGASATLPNSVNNLGQVVGIFLTIWHTNTGFSGTPMALSRCSIYRAH